MGKYFNWIYPQVNLCSECPKTGPCLSEDSGSVPRGKPPLKTRQCMHHREDWFKEVLKHKGFQILPMWDTNKAAKVAAASGSCGKPIMCINNEVKSEITTMLRDILRSFNKTTLWLIGTFMSVLLGAVLTAIFQPQLIKLGDWIKQVLPVSVPSQTSSDSRDSGASGGYTGNKTHSHNPVSISPKRGDKSQAHPASR
jgi:hypothetical protein